MNSWQIFYTSLIEKEGYKSVIKGLGTTLEIAIFGLIIGIIIGTLIAVVKVVPKYKEIYRILERVGDVYVAFFRGTPMVVQLLLAWFIIAPALNLKLDATVVSIVVFGMNSGAYVSEIMRSGIQSVDHGQLEAGRALGLSYAQTMIEIVIPQAIKNILPTIGNEFIVLIKDTSIVSFIAVVDLTKAFRSIADANYEYIVPYLTLAAVYLVLVLAITWLIKCLERRLKRSDRRH